jgi:hypothetical protein
MNSLLTLPSDILNLIFSNLTDIDHYILRLTHRRYAKLIHVTSYIWQSKNWNEYVKYPNILYWINHKYLPPKIIYPVIESGDVGLYQYLIDKIGATKYKWYKEFNLAAIRSNNFKMVQLIFKANPLHDPLYGSIAIKYRNLKIFKWLWVNGYINDSVNNFSYQCMQTNEIAILSYLATVPGQMSNVHCGRIFGYLHLPVLEWLLHHKIGVPVELSDEDKRYLKNMAINPQCIKYLVENNLPFAKDEILVNATMQGNEDILKYFI